MTPADSLLQTITKINYGLRHNDTFINKYEKESKAARDSLVAFYLQERSEEGLKSLPYRRWLTILDKENKHL